VAKLLAAELEVGLVRLLAAPPGLVATTIARQSLRVAVIADHRLAGRQRVELSELADDTIIVWGRPGRSRYTDFLMDLCRRAGFEPRIEINPVQGTPPITAVAETGQVAFVTTSPGATADGRVVVLDLLPERHVPLQAMSLERSASPLVGTFLSAVAARPPELRATSP